MTEYDFETNPEFPGTGDWGCPTYHFAATHDHVRVTCGDHVYRGPAADLVVRVVSSSGTRWVGYFASGLGGATAALRSPAAGHLLVVASGAPYLVDVEEPGASTVATQGMPVRSVIHLADSVLLASDLDITAVGASGVEWSTPRLCLDDLAVERVEDGVIQCTGWFGESDAYGRDEISIDLTTGRQVGGRVLPDALR